MATVAVNTLPTVPRTYDDIDEVVNDINVDDNEKDEVSCDEYECDVSSCDGTSTSDECEKNAEEATPTITQSVDSLSTDAKETDFLYKMVDLIFREAIVDETQSNNRPVCNFLSPEELCASLTELSIGQEGSDANKLIDFAEKVIKNSVKTAHPRFFNQLYGGLSKYSIAGAWCAEVLNSSMYTYEVAPVFTIMEREIYTKMLGLAGFRGGDAIFAPGGSISNLYAVNIARHHKFPQIKTKGVFSVKKPICIFASDQCHYSVQKAAAALGIGSDNVISVASDNKGRMLVSKLEMEIEKSVLEGLEPFMVVATAGTTVYGAYDPIADISGICEKYGIWLHVDGAWGGSVLLSKTHRHLMEGIEKADSLTWNAHKQMGVGQQCSVFLTKHKGLLMSCHSASAKYLFQPDKHYDVSYDTGDMSLQCGRKNDVFKLWLTWKAIGEIGMEKNVDHLFALSRHLATKLKQTDGFRLIMEPMCTNVCFWYIPPSMRDIPETPEWWQSLGKVTATIKKLMVKAGSMMITYNPEGSRVNFFRMVCTNKDTTFSDMDFVVDEIVALGVLL
ncbi:cysteine sulfinic acid decarboxylase-like [Mya arenaria]|nr:cysteine sulfinic acid decarboxylase-like [Mya arenaria]